MRGWVWVGGIAFTLNILLVGAATPSAAEDTMKPPSWFTAGPSLMDPASPEEIETAIQRLSEPIDQEQMNKIFFDLARLENAGERSRLQEMLEKRMQGLMEIPAPSTSQSSIDDAASPKKTHSTSTPRAVAVDHDPSQNELLVRIDTLNLGPDATADDLRVRDRLVSKIAGIRDPIMRDELLTKLEERERQAEEMLRRP